MIQKQNKNKTKPAGNQQSRDAITSHSAPRTATLFGRRSGREPEVIDVGCNMGCKLWCGRHVTGGQEGNGIEQTNQEVSSYMVHQTDAEVFVYQARHDTHV